MAVKSFMKSGGMTALAVGVAAFALPAVASAQEGRWSDRVGSGHAQAHTQAPAQTQGTGGHGNWSHGQAQTAPQVRVAPQQVQRNWTGGSSWHQNNVQQSQNHTYAPNAVTRSYKGYNGTRTYNGTHNWGGHTANSGNWNRNWRNSSRYNWQSYRNANRNVYHLGRYYSPYRNWSYRRFGVGAFLEPLFFGSNYWIDNPWQYRLPEAYGPYRWVRYYDDALLVDIYSGEVVDVMYDFFW